MKKKSVLLKIYYLLIVLKKLTISFTIIIH